MADRIRGAYDEPKVKDTLPDAPKTALHSRFLKKGLDRASELQALTEELAPSNDNTTIERSVSHDLGHGASLMLRPGQGRYLDLGPKDPRTREGGFKAFRRGIHLDTGDWVAILKAKGERGIQDLKEDMDVRKQIGDLAFVVEPGKLLDEETMVQKLYAGDMKTAASLLETPKQKLQFAIDVATGLAELHQKGFVHRDIKPDNLLVDRNGRGAVGDLGFVTNKPVFFGGTRGFIHPQMALNYLKNQAARKGPRKLLRGPIKAYTSLEEAKAFDTYALGLALGHLAGDEDSVVMARLHGEDVYDAAKQGDLDTTEDTLIGHRIEYQSEMSKSVWSKLKGRRRDSLAQIAREMRNPVPSQIQPLDAYVKRLLALVKH